MNLKGKKVVVVGLAMTGLAVARFLKGRGARVTAADVKPADQLDSHALEIARMGIPLKLGQHKIEDFAGSDLIVVSPGVPHNIAPLETAAKSGIPVIGEIELAFRHIDEPIVAISGTNGKTTTTRLVGEMLKASGLEVFVGGNIGAPLIGYVHSGMRSDVVVAEISSFQLDTIDCFKPKVGVLLNVTEDHLDRYKGFQEYVQSKGRLFENQDKTDFAVLNAGDPAVQGIEKAIASQRLYFNTDSLQESGAELPAPGVGCYGAVIRGTELTCIVPQKAPVTFSIAAFRPMGKHNIENVSAAALAAVAAGADRAGIQHVLDTYEGLPHRLEYVRSIGGVHYYNDSKATNVDAVKRSLESFADPVLLIMGGRDKGGSYSVLKDLVTDRVKGLFVIGEARGKILSSLGALTHSEEAGSLADAVRMAHGAATAGDIVLLSPGCSSFDMFRDYVERGEEFRRAVERL